MPVEKNMPLLQHLNEMRKMVITSLAAWLIAAMVIFFFFGDQVFQWVTLPLTRLDLKLIIISPMEGFTVKMSTCLFAGFVLTVPLILRQIWLFVSPALYPHERRRIIITLGCSFFLFLAGMAFAYTLFLGVALQFLLFTAGAGLSPMLVAGKYFNFLMAVLIPFGLAFQMPVIFWLLTRMGLITHGRLQKSRRVAVVSILIIAAVLTPTTDIVSLTLMAGPLYLLYEISVLISYLSRKKADSEREGL